MDNLPILTPRSHVWHMDNNTAEGNHVCSLRWCLLNAYSRISKNLCPSSAIPLKSVLFLTSFQCQSWILGNLWTPSHSYEILTFWVILFAIQTPHTFVFQDDLYFVMNHSVNSPCYIFFFFFFTFWKDCSQLRITLLFPVENAVLRWCYSEVSLRGIYFAQIMVHSCEKYIFPHLSKIKLLPFKQLKKI